MQKNASSSFLNVNVLILVFCEGKVCVFGLFFWIKKKNQFEDITFDPRMYNFIC